MLFIKRNTFTYVTVKSDHILFKIYIQLTGSGICEPITETGCTEALNLFVCRFCSPRYTEYLDSNGKLRICSTFADGLFKQCEKSNIFSVRDITCKTVGEDWQNSKDFIENVFDEVVVDPRGLSCFNSSSILLSNLMFAFTVLAAVLVCTI